VAAQATGQTDLDAMQVYVSSRFGDTIRASRRDNDPMVARVIPRRLWAAGARAIVRYPAPTPAERARADAVLAPVLRDLAAPDAQAGEAAIEQREKLDRIEAIARRMGPQMAPGAAIARVMLLFTIVLLPSLVSALAGRGGLGLRWSGLAVVTSDGQQASVLRGFWRAIVAWSPLLIGLLVMTTGPNSALEALLTGSSGLLQPSIGVDLTLNPGIAALRLALLATAAVAAAVMLAMAIWRPERSLQDRLAGTWLVPR
jgi:hypothetical protein